MRKRYTFTRAEIEDYFTLAFCTGLAADELVSIADIRRVVGVSPAMWIVSYIRHTGIGGGYYHALYNKAIIIAGRDVYGNPRLQPPETVILPEESAKREDPDGKA